MPRSFKVINFSTSRKPYIYDFVLVNNSKLDPISHRCQVISQAFAFHRRVGLYLSLTHSFGGERLNSRQRHLATITRNIALSHDVECISRS